MNSIICRLRLVPNAPTKAVILSKFLDEPVGMHPWAIHQNPLSATKR